MKGYKSLVWLVPMIAWAVSCRNGVDHSNKEIDSEVSYDSVFLVLDSQVAEWNRGSHSGFMDGYWESDSLRFITSRGVLFGHRPMLEQYQKSFPNRDDMCCLKFEDRQLSRLSDSLVLVTGRWAIERKDSSSASGPFSLIFKYIPEVGWRIIVDHTW